MAESHMQSATRIVSAPWVVVDGNSVIRNGFVAFDNERIIDSGSLDSIGMSYPGITVVSYPGVLMPALVNAHMHLELSLFPGTTPLTEDENFTDWVKTLLKRRFEKGFSDEDLLEAIAVELQNQHNLGVGLIGDIGNVELHTSIFGEEKTVPELYRMIELLGASKDAVGEALEKLESIDLSQPVTAHAPYSTRPELLSKIKQRCMAQGHIYSIHTAEVADEIEFITEKSGVFRTFLEQRGAWDHTFFEHGHKTKGTIEYFRDLGLLDEYTLLVHCVHVSDDDLKMIKESGSHICVCPGSNNYLHSGIAPVGGMIKNGIMPCLGTDSCSSNLSLNLWEEMKLVKDEHPDVNASAILAMATVAGARALHLEEYGSLNNGRKASFLHVFSDKLDQIQTEHDLLSELVANGKPDIVEWI